MLVGKSDEILCLGDGHGNRLFDEYVAVSLEQRAGNLAVTDRGGRDDDGVGRPRRLDRVERRHAVFGCDFGESVSIGVIGAEETYPVHAGEDAYVVAAEMAGSDNCGGDFRIAHGAQDSAASGQEYNSPASGVVARPQKGGERCSTSRNS